MNAMVPLQARSADFADAANSGRRARERCAAIKRYKILDTPDEAAFDDVTLLAARICRTPVAAISFVTADRQWVKAQVGLLVRQTPISQSFCAHVIERPGTCVIPDTLLDRRFADNPLVTGPPFIRFYAGVPIHDVDGIPIASLSVLDPVARPEGISQAEGEALHILASQVEAQLKLRRALILRDIEAVRHQRTTSQLTRIVNHDPLTGLPNRRLFQERCSQALLAAAASGERLAVMLIDVDHFKQINDSIGHDAGDALLCRFATRLRRFVRKTDTVARLGGDEFGIVFRGVGDDDQLSALLASLSLRLRAPFRHRGRIVDCRASIGAARYPEHADAVDGLLKCGDLALGTAKLVRDCGTIFTAELATRFEAQIEMIAVARQMLCDNQVVPYYQPKIDLKTGSVTGFEALLRWRRNNGAFAIPELLSTAFADRDLARAISTRVMETVVDDIAHWMKTNTAFGRIAINSCAADYRSNDFAERLLDRLAARTVPTTAIEVEITEDVFLGRGCQYVARALSLLDAHGVRIALDDFGTGYASLTHLKKFPLHALKIDRSFISGLDTNPDDRAIVRALVALGASLGLETVAEGVETLKQASVVRGYGCDVAQGYLYGAACAATDVPALIARFSNKLAA
jgi:diguanylate cyclase (GGDEF)-like protein